jgi:uncharacterized protein YcbK (DUF882 family)
LQRRHFLLGGLAALAAAPGLVHAKVDPEPRHLFLYHTHTDEALDIVYRRGEAMSRPALKRLNHFLRDFRTEEVTSIDPRLFDLLYDLKHRLGRADSVFEIISAYRSPTTNAMLRKHSNGVAKRSLHLDGKALDVRLRGAPTAKLRDVAMDLRRGGVGYYRRSNFVHLDTGRVRSW